MNYFYWIVIFACSVKATPHTHKIEEGSSVPCDHLHHFRHENLMCHNRYRDIHHAHHLVTSSELNKQAQKYAEELAAAGKFEHSTGSGYGENLYYGRNIKHFNGSSACKMWYDEIKEYSFKDTSLSLPSNFYSVGHFTQMVWTESKKIGTGCAKGANGKVIVVSQYQPPGNVRGQFASKVNPPKKKH